MSTLRQHVSDIRSRHKLLSYDIHLTDRYIASEFRDTTLLLIKRETDKRKLWNTDTLFTPIPCIQMQEVPLASCCSYTSPKTIARSIHKLPRIAEGVYQYLISGVYNIEGTKELKYLPLKKYLNFLKLDVKANEAYYFLQDDYLFCTDSNIKALKMLAFPEEDIPQSLLHTDCGCGTGTHDCINPLDLEFNIPGYLAKNAKDMVSEVLMKTYERLPEDKTSDDRENS